VIDSSGFFFASYNN